VEGRGEIAVLRKDTNTNLILPSLPRLQQHSCRDLCI